MSDLTPVTPNRLVRPAQTAKILLVCLLPVLGSAIVFNAPSMPREYRVSTPRRSIAAASLVSELHGSLNEKTVQSEIGPPDKVTNPDDTPNIEEWIYRCRDVQQRFYFVNGNISALNRVKYSSG
jgi:hypothetical protein